MRTLIPSEVPKREEKCRLRGFLCVLSSCWCLRHLPEKLPQRAEKFVCVKEE